MRANRQTILSSRNPIVVATVIFVFFTVGFFIFRTSAGFFWDDTPAIAQIRYQTPSPTELLHDTSWKHLLVNSFSRVTESGFRPLSVLIYKIGAKIFSDPNADPRPWILVLGIVFGLTALLLFYLALRLTGSRWTAGLSIFLFMFSPAVISGAWVIFAGIQIIVPFLILLEITLYFKMREATGTWTKKGWGTLLILIMLLGPWFREFVGIAPLLIIILEWRDRKRFGFWSVFSIAMFFHAVFPMALIKWLFSPDIPLRCVFQIGSLGTFLNNEGGSWWHIRGIAFWTFLMLLPSTIFILALCSYIATPVVYLSQHAHVRRGLTIKQLLKSLPIDQVYLPSIIGLGIIAALLSGKFQIGLGFWLCAGIAGIAFKRNPFLCFWFLLTFLPFLKVYSEHIHLAYPLLPAVIVLSEEIRIFIWDTLRRNQTLPVLRYLTATLLAIAIVDHGLNPFRSVYAVQAMERGMDMVAQWLEANVPAQSIVVSNVLHNEEIRLKAHNHIQVFWSNRSWIPDKNRNVARPEDLQKLLTQNNKKHPVYFLEVNGKDSHSYVHWHSLDLLRIGRLATVRATYPYLDPIKCIIPRALVLFLGSPDMMDDYYCGPAQQGPTCFSEIYASYDLYEVRSDQVWSPRGEITKIGDYRGFTIFLVNGRFFAIPAGSQRIFVNEIYGMPQYKSFFAVTEDDLKRDINHWRSANADSQTFPTPGTQ